MNFLCEKMKNLTWVWLSFFLLSPISVKAEATEIFSKLQSLNQMRESLASTLDGKSPSEINEDTFKVVCMPVGKELKRWAEEKGYQVRQISHKNRNPNHGLKAHEEKIYQKFLEDPQLNESQVEVSEKDLQGHLYYARINVVQSCLHCHGEKKSRPEFIQTKYQNDKAYGFKSGDLRGLYSVFVSKKAKGQE